MSRTSFGLYARKLRIRAGLSQKDVADKLAFKSAQLVSNWERGQCYPPIDSLRMLTKLYKVKLRNFFDKYHASMKEDWWAKVNGTANAKPDLVH